MSCHPVFGNKFVLFLSLSHWNNGKQYMIQRFSSTRYQSLGKTNGFGHHWLIKHFFFHWLLQTLLVYLGNSRGNPLMLGLTYKYVTYCIKVFSFSIPRFQLVFWKCALRNVTQTDIIGLHEERNWRVSKRDPKYLNKSGSTWPIPFAYLGSLLCRLLLFAITFKDSKKQNKTKQIVVYEIKYKQT